MIFLITQDTIIIKRFLNYYFYVDILIVFYAMLLHYFPTGFAAVLLYNFLDTISIATQNLGISLYNNYKAFSELLFLCTNFDCFLRYVVTYE